MKNTKLLNIAAMCLALGVVLPQAFHFIPNAGNIFLPMHIPVLICGFVCGPIYGLIVGVITPCISHILFQMPIATMLSQMIIELGVYGLCTGLFNEIINIKNKIVKNYIVLIIAMLMGRITYGICNALIFKANAYSMNIWLTVAFIQATPGIIIQLTIIPTLIKKINIKN